MSIPLRACRPHLTAAQGPHLKAARILRLSLVWVALRAKKSSCQKMPYNLSQHWGNEAWPIVRVISAFCGDKTSRIDS